MEQQLSMSIFSKSLLSPIKTLGENGDLPLPLYVYRNCQSSISSLEVVSLYDSDGLQRDFLWAGEEDGNLTIYDLATNRLALSFNISTDDSFKSPTLSTGESSIITIMDLKGGYVLTYSRSAGIQIWLWGYDNTETVRLSPEKPQDKILSIPLTYRRPGVLTPKLVASLVTGSVSFCGISLADIGTSEEDNLVKDGETRIIWLLAPSFNTHQLQLFNLTLPPIKPQNDVPTIPEIVPCINHVENISFSNENPKNITTIKLYSHPCPNSETDRIPQLFFLVGFDDGAVAWYYIKLLEISGQLKFERCYLLWCLEQAHIEPVMGVAIASDHGSGYSVGADNQVTRFIFDYSSIKSTIGSITFDDNLNNPFKVPLLVQPNEERKSFRRSPTGPGSVSLSIRPDGRVLALGHFNFNVGLYSAISLRPLTNLNFHRKSITCSLYYTPPYPLNLETSLDSPRKKTHLLFVGSQDSRISLWKVY